MVSAPSETILSPQNSRCKLLDVVMRIIFDALALRHAVSIAKESAMIMMSVPCWNLTGRSRTGFELWKEHIWKLQSDLQNEAHHRKPLERQSCAEGLQQSRWLRALRLCWVVSCTIYRSLVVKFWPQLPCFCFTRCTYAHLPSFLNKFERLAARDYLPNVKDMCWVQAPTTQVYKETYKIHDTSYT